MNFQLNYTKQRAKSQISGAIGFDVKEIRQLKNRYFPKKTISKPELLPLCEELDGKLGRYNSVEEFVKDDKYFFGPKKYRLDELHRVLKLHPQHLEGFLASFPFKCPVPSKTNYHTTPDFGEIMFLYRVGKLAKIFQNVIHKPTKITILEETQALENVFSVSTHESRKVREKLKDYVRLLDLENHITLASLQKATIRSNRLYNQKLLTKTQEVMCQKEKYTDFIAQVLPTIALSMQSTNMSIFESQKSIISYFNTAVTLEKDQELFMTAFRYIAYTLLQRESDFKRNLYPNFLEFSVCPKKGRIAIRPTLRSVKILPHHGVPVITVGKKKKKFSIEYYIDFLETTKQSKVSEVLLENGDFIFYEVDESKKASV